MRTASGSVLAAVALTAACTLLPAGCAEPPLDAAVLISRDTPQMGAALPEGRVSRIAVEGFKPGRRATTVVVAGHSAPPLYLGRPAAEMARAIASFAPELIVLDTCFGASTPLLEALAAEGSRARVVAPAFRLPESGFVYAPDFFSRAEARERAEAVNSVPQAPLLRWAIAPEPLQAARAELAALSTASLRQRLRFVEPPLVRLSLGEAGWVVAPIARERLL